MKDINFKENLHSRIVPSQKTGKNYEYEQFFANKMLKLCNAFQKGTAYLWEIWLSDFRA
ncbi:hypothetical protein [Bdellovibrio sp. HCB2-146]|uniref:hypothetical protein n=1 Tax=Bdellovibrio sp. HCB2-146 TaxID=3394362 RepID=UPI0039BD1A20